MDLVMVVPYPRVLLDQALMRKVMVPLPQQEVLLQPQKELPPQEGCRRMSAHESNKSLMLLPPQPLHRRRSNRGQVHPYHHSARQCP